MVRLGPPVESAPGCIGGSGEGGTEHDRVGTAGDRLDDVAARAQPAVGDDVDVATTGLVEVVTAGRRDVGDRTGHRGVDAERLPGRVRRSPAEADEDARGTGAHQVQGCGVARGATDDHRHVELVDEALEVERLAAAAHVLRGDGRAADDEEVDPGVDDGLPVLLGVLRAEGTGDGDPRGAQLAQPLGDQLRLDRGGVDLLHARGRQGGVERGDLRQERLGVAVARPQPLEVEHRQPPGLAEGDRRRRRHHRVHRRGDDRHLEVVGIDLPVQGDLLGVARTPTRQHRDVVEGVGPAAPLASADLDLVHPHTLIGLAPDPRGRILTWPTHTSIRVWPRLATRPPPPPSHPLRRPLCP